MARRVISRLVLVKSIRNGPEEKIDLLVGTEPIEPGSDVRAKRYYLRYWKMVDLEEGEVQTVPLWTVDAVVLLQELFNELTDMGCSGALEAKLKMPKRKGDESEQGKGADKPPAK